MWGYCLHYSPQPVRIPLCPSVFDLKMCLGKRADMARRVRFDRRIGRELYVYEIYNSSRRKSVILYLNLLIY